MDIKNKAIHPSPTIIRTQRPTFPYFMDLLEVPLCHKLLASHSTVV